MVLPLIPLIVILASIIGGIALTFWLMAVIEVLRVVLTILVIPVLFKLFGDVIAYYGFKMDKTISTVLGLAFAVLVAIVLYIHFWALFIGTAILYGIFLIGPRLVGEGIWSNALSLKSWFGERRKK